MSAPDKIYAWQSSTKPQGVSLAGGKVDDQIEYTRSDLIAARAVEVKPLDLSNMLKHAFIAGRISAGASSSFHGHAWAEYDPTESAAYARILSALHPASPLGAVAMPEVRALVDVLTSIKSTWILPSAIQLALDAALAPFARKGE